MLAESFLLKNGFRSSHKY